MISAMSIGSNVPVELSRVNCVVNWARLWEKTTSKEYNV